MKIAILGAGAWGTALAINLSHDHEVVLWARNAVQIAEMQRARVNASYLPHFTLPDRLTLEATLDEALVDADLVIIVTSTAGLRNVLKQIAACQPTPPIIWACKGLEAGSALLPHQVVIEEIGDQTPCGVLSGPSFAKEVAAGLPTAITLASTNVAFARSTAATLHNARLRVYSSEDVIGVEVGGAIKNVMAIAAGVADGLSLGHNARAALITRGLAEITRFGIKLGGKLETFMGLSGIGDLILTCTGDLSRNRQVGLLLSQGKSLNMILKELGHVAEGVSSTQEVFRMAKQLDIEMPITSAVYQLLYENVPAQIILNQLLERQAKEESVF